MKKNIRLKGANDIYLLLKFTNERKSCMEGWVKLYRKLLSSNIFQNEKLLKVWIWCLLKASHKECTQLVGRQTVNLKEGQFVFGRKKASEELKMKESTVRDYMLLLKNLQNIDIKSDNKFSVITVLNWDLYQIDDKKSDSKTDNKSTTNQQQINTNKNIKNDKSIFIYFINKYKSNEKNFEKQMKIISQMRKDEKWDELTQDEQLDLQTAIFN